MHGYNTRGTTERLKREAEGTFIPEIARALLVSVPLTYRTPRDPRKLGDTSG